MGIPRILPNGILCRVMSFLMGLPLPQDSSGFPARPESVGGRAHRALGIVPHGRGGPPAACRPPDRITLRLPGWDGRADLRANYIAGDHQLHPPILLPALRGVIGSDWRGFAEALRRDRTPRHSLLDQVIAHRRAALLGKPLIVLVPADAVGVTFHVQPQTRMPGDDAGHL